MLKFQKPIPISGQSFIALFAFKLHQKKYYLKSTTGYDYLTVTWYCNTAIPLRSISVKVVVVNIGLYWYPKLSLLP